MAKVKSAKAIMAPMREGQSVRVEKIANGFLAHHSSEGPNGYQTKTVFHPTKPVLTVGVSVSKKGKGK